MEVKGLFQMICNDNPMDRKMLEDKFGALFPEPASTFSKGMRSHSNNSHFYKSNAKNCENNTLFNRYERLPEKPYNLSQSSVNNTNNNHSASV